MDETKNLRYCYEILRRRIFDEDEHYGLWRMKLKITTYFLKRYDTDFDPDHWDYVKELSDSEECSLLENHPLLQSGRVYGERFRKHSIEFEVELRKKIGKYFECKARYAAPV